MNLSEEVRFLRDAFPDRDWEERQTPEAIYLTCPNPGNPRFPLKVCIGQTEGYYVDLGDDGWLLELGIDRQEAAELIAKVFRDEIVVVVAGRKGAFSTAFDLTDDDEREEYEAFCKKLERPRTFWERLNPFALKGTIEISDWSGGRYWKTRRI